MDPFPLRGLVELVLAGRPWQVTEDSAWCHVSPTDYPPRPQGWKLHVSATTVSVPLVLQRAAAVLVAHGCAFKFARTLTGVSDLTSKHTDRAQAGKVITAYPRDDDHLREVATLLDRATAGLPGPAILSDRPLRPGSLVHYRYGAFAGVPVFTNDGSSEVRLEAPDGSLVDDARQPWFCPPSWATLPFEGAPGRKAAGPREPRSVLLADRFEMRSTITTSARGGVYRGVDHETGQAVVIKRARPHIGGLVWQGDAREGLRREFQRLGELSGIAAQPVTLFEQDDNLFLVLRQVPGTSLREWIRDRWLARSREGEEDLPLDQVLSMAHALADLLDAVHARGLVYRDFTASNIMVGEDGGLLLIDAEMAAGQDEWVIPAQTPGFAAPEVSAQRDIAPAPPPSSDWFALGALLCHLAVGGPPVFAPDSEPGRPPGERMELLLRLAGARNAAAASMAPAILGLTRTDPDSRWSTATLRQWLTDREQTTAEPERSEQDGRLRTAEQRRLIDDGLAHVTTRLTTNLATPGRDRLFDTGELGGSSDACNVQYGAAGVLAVLTRASTLDVHHQAGNGNPSLREVVTRVAQWIDHRLLGVPKLLPGLYFGRAGTAWALYDAARHLDDTALTDRALLLAQLLPARWPNPDVCHGAAGAGFANLHLWQATGDAAFRERLGDGVDGLLEAATYTDDGLVCWPVPESFDSRLAGVNHFGFAHGVAGVGAFLLAAGSALGREDALKTARLAGDSLAAGAIREGGAAYWPNNVSGPDREDLRYHWCSGASGVGTFLVRLWRSCGEQTYLDLAHEAAVTVHRGRWTSGTAACHGLAGDGEFLLDMAEAVGGDYRWWAEELAGCLYARHAVRDGRMVVPDESDAETNLSYNTGVSGALGFLLRLRHGGPRWWMADETRNGPDRPARPDPT